MLSEGSPQAPGAEPAELFGGAPYRTVQRLTAGGMGDLYVVEHQLLQRTFVAKVLQENFARDDGLLDRFRLEAQALGRLNHPHIVSVTDVGTTTDGRPYMLLEHLEGRTLDEELGERGRLPVREALQYAEQLLSALSAAHAISIVHRDIKPSNLFLCNRPDGSRVLKVLDFGIARVMPRAVPRTPRPLAAPTDTGVVMGTPRFVSPEGAVGRRVDERADLYAASLVLYTMLVGRGPFDHISGHMSLLTAHARAEPQPPSHYAEEPVPPELDRAVLKGLEKDPEKRYQTAEEFREILRHLSELLARPTGWLVTTVFSANSLARVRSATPHDASNPLLAEDSNRVELERDDESAELPSAPSQVGIGEATGNVTPTAPRSSVAPRRPPLVLVTVFVIGVLAAAAAAAGLVAILRGFT